MSDAIAVRLSIALAARRRKLRDPEGDRNRMQRRRDNLSFLIIFGSIIAVAVALAILAKGPSFILKR